MDDWFLEIVKQVPALGVLAGVVWMFLRSLREGAVHNEKISKDFTDSIQGFAREIRDVSTRCHDLQQKATDATAHNTEVLRELKDEIKKR